MTKLDLELGFKRDTGNYPKDDPQGYIEWLEKLFIDCEEDE